MNDKVKKLTPYTDGKRRKMVMTKLTAVALTARGANPEANVTFYKSHKGTESVEKGGDLVNMLTTETDGHQHGISIEIYGNELYMDVKYAGGSGADNHYHALVRTSDGAYSVSTNEGHSHEVDSSALNDYLLSVLNKEEIKDTITKSQADLLTAVNIDGIEDNLEDAMSKELELALAKAEGTITKQAADLASATTVMRFTPIAKAFYDTLSVADKESFVGKTDADRVATMEMAKSADPVVYTATDGTEFHKSAGDATVKLAKRVDDQDREIAKQSALNKHSVFVKRAADEMGNMTGDDVTKIALLGAIETIENEETRKAVGEMIKASNSGAAVALDTLGTSTPAEVKKAGDQLDVMAKSYADEHKVDEATAYSKVLETEAGQKLYNEANA